MVGVIWNEWEKLNSLEDFRGNNSIINSTNDLSDFNNAIGNRFYCINVTDINNIPVQEKGNLLVFSMFGGKNTNDFNNPQGKYCQFYVTNTNQLYYRSLKFAQDIIWNDWKKVAIEDERPTYYNSNSATVFNKILCVGDSTTAGVCNYIENGSQVNNVAFTNYSYPTQLTKISGIETTNLGKPGYSTKQWYEFYQNADLSGYDCAIIALGINDPNIGITTQESDEYLRLIINKLKTQNNNIKIFISSILPNYYRSATGDKLTYYNQLNEDRELTCDELDNCYFVDMSTYGRAYGQYYAQGHPTAIGYNLIARDFYNYISYIIDNNPNEFRNVQFIGTNYNY